MPLLLYRLFHVGEGLKRDKKIVGPAYRHDDGTIHFVIRDLMDRPPAATLLDEYVIEEIKEEGKT